MLQQEKEKTKTCCKDKNLDYCLVVDVQSEVLNDKQDIDVLGSILTFYANDTSSFVYKNDKREYATIR